MAVAVKNNPEVAAASPFDRLPVVCLFGAVYILGCLGVVFRLLPSLLLPFLSGLGLGEKAAGALLGMAMLAAATALLFLSARMLGSHAPPGTRAGLFTTLAGVLLILLLTRWASMWIEHWVYRDYLFASNGPTAGAAVTAAIGLGMLGYGILMLFKKSTEKLLVAFEGQGWFSATSYKSQQGQKVRRGTILGALIIAAAGIYTLLTHGTLGKIGPNLELSIPFSGMVVVENPGDIGEFLKDSPKKTVDNVEYPLVSRYELRAINDLHANPNKYVKLTDEGRFPPEALRGQEGKLIPKETFDEEVKKLRDAFNRENENVRDEVREAELKRFEGSLPKKVDPEPASGTTTVSTLTLLPGVQFTVPLLLLVASLWLAWRVVNLPPFADFLIATEAELNKVSWTTRKRLFQDTIVVLATVFLLAVFLFAMDQSWRVILSWKPIGVLQFPEDQAEQNKSVEEKPW